MSFAFHMDPGLYVVVLKGNSNGYVTHSCVFHFSFFFFSTDSYVRSRPLRKCRTVYRCERHARTRSPCVYVCVSIFCVIFRLFRVAVAAIIATSLLITFKEKQLLRCLIDAFSLSPSFYQPQCCATETIVMNRGEISKAKFPLFSEFLLSFYLSSSSSISFLKRTRTLTHNPNNKWLGLPYVSLFSVQQCVKIISIFSSSSSFRNGFYVSLF